jgi:predicted small lipoprotein YifL
MAISFLFYGGNSASIAGYFRLSMPPGTMRITIMLLCLGLLAACGQKGALYLPEKPAQAPANPTSQP